MIYVYFLLMCWIRYKGFRNRQYEPNKTTIKSTDVKNVVCDTNKATAIKNIML